MLSSVTISVLFATVLALCTALPDERIAPGVTPDVTKTLSDIFDQRAAPFGSIRHPLVGDAGRQNMLKFIENRLEAIQLRANQTGLRSNIESISFNTTILDSSDRKQVRATNLVFVLHGKKMDKQDEPLLLLAHYDTPVACNQVNEASGVAALLVLAELLVNEVDSRQLTLKNSIVFAFTDVAFKKYAGNHAAEGVTGGVQIAKEWLPRFLLDRKSFKGAIVLDNIMNYNDAPRSQLVTGVGIDKSFPRSYEEISSGDFTGNFLGLVHRDDHLDHPLVAAIEEAWRQTMKEVKATSTINYADPKLLKFAFTSDLQITPSVNHFSMSEQTSFWNVETDAKIKNYGAVLLTDTRLYRVDEAMCVLQCDVGNMKTKKNLQFMTRTVKTLHSVILNWQTDANGALSSLQVSSYLFLGPLLIYLVSNIFFNRV